jgi:hypothetical protein
MTPPAMDAAGFGAAFAENPARGGGFWIVAAGIGRYPPSAKKAAPRMSADRGAPGSDAMKLRSSLLLACMLVVPALAMFSHKIPPEVRRAVRQRVWDPAIEMVAGVAGSAPKAADNAPLAPSVPPAPAGQIAAVPDRQPALDIQPAPSPIASAPTPPTRSVPASVFTSATEAARPVRPSVDAGSVRTMVESRLADLGAVAFDCTPAPDGGLHRCSCRVAADPSGQLQRVFQSADPDPAVAMQNLLGQVQFWKQRLASRATGDNPLRPKSPGQSTLVR